MTNPYEQFTQPSGSTASTNPYASFQGDTVDAGEQDVVHRTNNPALETPHSFGLTEIPSDFVHGLAASVAVLPQVAGNAMQQIGDTIKDASLKMSLMGFTAKKLAGDQTANLDQAVEDFKAPSMMVNAGNALVEKNKAWMESAGLIPKGGTSIAYDAGNLFGQVGVQVGLAVVSKSPALGAAYMSALIDSQTYQEAKQKDLSEGKPYNPDRWSAIAATDAAGQGLIAMIGGNMFMKAAETSSAFTRVIQKALGLGVQGLGMGAVNEAVTNVSGVRNETAPEIAKNIGYTGALMMLAGVPLAAVHVKIEDMGKKAGLPDETATKLATNLITNKDMIVDGATSLIDKEGAGVLNVAPAQTEALNAMKAVKDQAKAVDEAIQKGTTEDPEIARQIILKSEQVPRETRLTLQNMPENFTMEDIRNVVGDSLPEMVKSMTPSAAFQEFQRFGPQPPGPGYWQRVAERTSEGRIAKLDDDIAAIDRHMNELLNVMDERGAQDKPVTKHENAMDMLFQKREALDEERAHLLTNTPDKNARLIGNAPITLKAGKLMAMAKESITDQKRALAKGFRAGMSMAKENIKGAQTYIAELIQESGLTSHDKGKFINAIKNIQSGDQVKGIQKIQSRIMNLLDEQQRREAVARIRGVVAKIKKSSTIAVDFGKKAEAMIDSIDTKGRSPETIASLQKTMDYLKANPDAEIPGYVVRQLDLLNKRRLEDVPTSELQRVADAMEQKLEQGKVKLKLMQEQAKRLKQTRLVELQKDTVPLVAKETVRAPIGERLTAMQAVKNKYADFANRVKSIGLATNPMDVFFDMLDGGKNYAGANYKIFKATVDKAFSRYLNTKEDATREVKNLTDKLDLDEKNFEKIGAWAVLQQEGGEKKLLDTGYTQKEIDGLVLSPAETKMYNLMRTKLDEMLPAIQDIMRIVYNKNVEGVSDYFPFMTDWEKAEALEIQDQIGDAVPQFGKKKNVERGFTKSRTGGKQKVRIDALNVFLKHVDNAAYLVEMGQHIKQLGDVAASEEYGRMAGQIGQEMVVDWVDTLARKGNVPGRIPALDAMRRNLGFAVLGFKLSSILIQPTSLADGASLIGGSYVARGMKAIASDEWRSFLWKNLPEVREREGDDPAYLDMGGASMVGDVRRAGFWALKKLDGLAASAVAAGAYMKSVEERGGEVDFSKPDPKAIEDAQLMMRRTQSSSFAKDAPPLISQGKLTGNISVDKLIFQFQSFMLNRWSLIKHDMWQLGIKKGAIAKSLNIATWMILATAAEVGVRRLTKDIMGALTGDKPDEWAKTITSEAVNTTLGNVPFVSQAVNAVQYGSVPVPVISATTQFIQQLQYAAEAKSAEKKQKHLMSAAILGAGSLAGIPGAMQADQILRKSTKKSSSSKSSTSTP